MNLPFENPLFSIPVVSGLIFILLGIIMSKFPPKKINYIYGYRTNNSMKNQERWSFAQKYSANEMIRLGSLLTLSGVLGFFLNTNIKIGTFLGLSLMILMVIILLIRVEKAIKEKFEKN